MSPSVRVGNSSTRVSARVGGEEEEASFHEQGRRLFGGRVRTDDLSNTAAEITVANQARC